MIKKIPDIELPKIYKEADFIDEEFVEITNDCGILVDMQYPKLNMKESINKCLVRKTVYDMLLKAKENLPSDLTFKIWDAYRPLALQKEIYYKYKDMLIEEFHLEGLPEDEQEEVIRNYVSLPKEDSNIPPLHATGGAVDLTLTRISDGTDLDMGVGFDSFSDLTNTSAFEKDGMNEEIRQNRRILYNAMIDAGFTNLPSECWHYEYGNRNWAYYKNKKAIYKGVFKL